MKASVKRKYIYITPTPKEDIPGGLWVKFDKGTETATNEACCDIYNGQMRYKKPEDSRKIIKAWVKK